MAGLVPFNNADQDIIAAGMAANFQNMLDDFFTEGWLPRRTFLHDTFKIDIEDCDKDYVITAEVPGVKKNEVAVDMDDGRLTITVTREAKVDEKDKTYVHKERSASSMSRSVYLADATTEGLDAKLDNGVLSITVPKAGPVSKKTAIEIK